MANTPDHMAGINALPSMRAYNDALTSARYGADRSTRTIEQSRALSKQLETFRNQAQRDKYGSANLLSRDLSKELKQAQQSTRPGEKASSRAQIKQRAKNGATLWADQDSECFASVSWEADDDTGEDGTCTLEFWRGGQVVYDVDMTFDEFLEFANSDSLGGYFNDFIK